MTEQNSAILMSTGLSEEAVNAYTPFYKGFVSAIVAAPDSLAAISVAKEKMKNWIDSANAIAVTQLGFNTVATREEYIMSMVSTIFNPWFKYFLSFDPGIYLQKVKAKVLAINGSKDIQVLPASNLGGIASSLKKSKAKYEIVELDGLNHLFQTCKKCTLVEYGEIEETMAPVVLELMTSWLNKNVK